MNYLHSRAKELNVPITVHAGEWPEKFKTLENLKFALNHFNVNRIGHGITLRSDLDYLKTLSKQNVTIEVYFFIRSNYPRTLNRAVHRQIVYCFFGLYLK